MNKALPIEKLRGAVFGEPLPQAYGEMGTQIGKFVNVLLIFPVSVGF